MRRDRTSRTVACAVTLLGAIVQSGCPSTHGPEAPTRSSSTASAQTQLSYCEQLQPQLDAAGQQAAIGSQLQCLELPGITQLGRFGHADIPEEGDLSACFDSPQAFDRVVQQHSEKFELDLGTHASASLASVIPWLPKLGAGLNQARHLSARVAIRDARFVTLVELASGLQTQGRAEDCLRGLCSPQYRYVHKALVGIPTVVLQASDARGRRLQLDTAVATAGWNRHQRDDASLQLSSSSPVTIAIARSGFRTPYTEPLCAECGDVAQPCCVVGSACNTELACIDGHCQRTGHLGEPCRPGDDGRPGGRCEAGSACLDDRCVAAGQAGEPCDGGRCRAGATCIDDWCVAAGRAGQPCENGGCRDSATCVVKRCRTGCGGRDQPCCERKACARGFTCRPTKPPEVRVSSESVELESSLFGVSQDRLFGHAACGEAHRRTRFVTRRISGDGNCERARWFAPERTDDCRVGVHLSAPTFGEVKCLIEIYSRRTSEERCQPY